MKLAATVILFNPPADVYCNIMTYYGYVDFLIAIDNSPQSIPSLQNKLTELDNILYIHKKENIGISSALNIAANEAINRGFSWLLTMDQDSSFKKLDIEHYLNALKEAEQDLLIGMVGVNYENKVSAKKDVLEDVPHLITSGSVLNLTAYKKTGPFDERFFIDEVDAEYSYRLRLNNFRVCMLMSCFMHHNLGQDIIVRNWFVGPKVRRNIHVPVRIYYMVRNFLLLSSIYKKEFPGEFKINRKVLCNRIKNAVLYSENRYKVIVYFFRGLADFRKKKFGKLETNSGRI